MSNTQFSFILSILNNHESPHLVLLTAQRTFSVWARSWFIDEVCSVEKASGTTYMSAVRVLAGWWQKFIASYLTKFTERKLVGG